MTKPKIYVSSTYIDLRDLREILNNYIQVDLRDTYELSRVMEHMRDSYTNSDFLSECVTAVAACDIYILIIGDSAGSSPPLPHNLLTYTEHEYKTAAENDKKIFRLKKKTPDWSKCKDKNQYEKFVLETAGGRYCHEFDNENEFRIQFLEFFNRLLSDELLELRSNIDNRIEVKYTEDQLLSCINRDIQYHAFKKYHKFTSSIQFFYYQHKEEDKADLFNFRITNIELEEPLLERERTYMLLAEKIYKVGIDAAINSLSEKFFGLSIYQTEKGEEQFNKEIDKFIYRFKISKWNNLLIPITIYSKSDENPIILQNLNDFFHQFESHKVDISNKRIFIFIAICKKTDEELDNELIKTISNNLTSPIIDLKTMEKLSEEDIRIWIKSFINNDGEYVNSVIQKHFSHLKDKDSLTTVYNAAVKSYFKTLKPKTSI